MPLDASNFAENNTVNMDEPSGPSGVAIPQGAQQVLSPTAQQTYSNAINYALPGLGVGLVDTLGQSVGVLHDHTVPDFLKEHLGGAGSFGDFYTNNQPQLRAGGELLGMLLPGLGAMKVLKTVKLAREAGAFGEAIAGGEGFGNAAMDMLLGNSADLTARETAISNAAVEEGKSLQGIWAGRTVNTPAMLQAKRSYYTARALDSVRTTVAFEMGTRLAFNSSDIFYPADYTLTDQLKWAGLGLGVGGALEMAASKYAVRNLIQVAQKAYGANAEEFGTIEPSVSNLIGAKNADKITFRSNQRGVGVSQLAGLSSGLDEIGQISANATLKNNFAVDQNIIKAAMTKQIGAMGWDSHPILPRVSLSPEQINLGIEAARKDNTALLFATKLGNVPDGGAANFYTDLTDTILKAAKKNDEAVIAGTNHANPAIGHDMIVKAGQEYKPIHAAGNEIHYIIENDGRTTIYKNRADNWLDQNDFKAIKAESYKTPDPMQPQGPGLKNHKLTLQADHLMTLHDNFRAEIPANATPLDYSGLYAAGSKLISAWKPVEGQTFVLTPSLSWRTIEGTLALADANPQAKSLIRLGGDFGSIEDARFHVLNEKIKGAMADMAETSAPTSAIRARIQGSTATYTPAQIMQKYNLPEPSHLTPSPIAELMAHMKLQGMDDLYEMFPMPKDTLTPPSYTRMDLLQQHLRETAGIKDGKVEMPIQGVLLQQKDVKPVFVAATAAPMMSRADAMIGGMVQSMRDIQLQRIGQITPQDSPIVSLVTSSLVKGDATLTGAANQARAVQTLQDGVVSGTGQIVYQDRINEQYAALKAMQLLAQQTDTITKNYFQTLAGKRLSPLIATILHTNSKADLFDFNRIEQAYRQGWDITGFVKNPAGGNGYVAQLVAKDKSRINPLLMDRHFAGKDIPNGAEGFMPDMSVTALKQGYSPLVVSKTAADIATAISDMSKQSGHENNTLRTALGSNPIKLRDFHLPNPELSSENAWFVRNDAGNVIHTYASGNVRENQKLASEAADLLNKSKEFPGSNHTAVPLSIIQRDHLMNDENFMDFIDYSDQLVKTGKGISGSGGMLKIDNGDSTLKNMVNTLQRQYLNLGIRARAAIFEPELNYARQASVAAAGVRRENLGGINIFDRYLSTAFSQSPVQGKGPLQTLYGSATTAFDRSLSYLNSYLTEKVSQTGDGKAAVMMRQVLRKQSNDDEFKAFQKTIPEWNPLNDVNKWAESTFHQQTDPRLAEMTAALSRVTSTLAIRFMDTGMALVHWMNLATNLPAVTTALRKLPNESLEQWRTRTAGWQNEIANGIPTFSPMKSMNKAIRSYWKGELTGPMTAAAKLGYFEPEYASLTKILTTPPSTKLGNYLKTFNDASVYLVDHSEILSRKITWGVGYKIGKELHGFTDEKNAYIFANNFVNDVVGNYSPNNKPAMFTGAIGQPIGVFQTYMGKYMHRMYSYVETGNKAAAMSQYAGQALLFGAESTPGYAAWNAAFQSNEDGSDDFTNRINRRFAPGVGELILHGSIDSIPKIWGGMQADGFNFHVRGAGDYTEAPPTLLNISRSSPMQFLANTYQGIVETVNNVFAGSNFTMQRQAEIMQAFTTNKALKSIMMMAADVDVDKRGRVIQQGTRDAIHMAAALLGTQPASTQGLIDASNRERNVQITQEDLRATLNAQTQALIRTGDISVTQLQNIMHEYLRSGGNKAYIGQYFRNNFMAASTPKSIQTMKQLVSSGKMLEFENMLSAIQQNQAPNTPAQK